MKRIIVSALIVLLLLSSLLMFPSCQTEEGEEGTKQVLSESITLYVYNWGEYISDGSEDSFDTNAEFENYCREELGLDVTVNYSTFSSNEDMYAKVSNNLSMYDVIIPSDYMVERMVQNDMLLPLDLEKIPNYEFISDDFKGENVYYECGKKEIYSIPYFYGMVGVIYNSADVDPEDPDIGSWDLMWSENYRGGILQFNNSRDAFGTALYKLGYSVNDSTESQWREALDLLVEQKKVVQGYVMDEIFNKMESGSASVASYYAGDFFTMFEENEDLCFFYPEEGTNSYVDAMCIPKGSKHSDLAMAYINFMCEPEVAVANAEYTYYASPLDMDALRENPDYVEFVEEYEECMSEVHPDAVEILYGEAAASVPTEAYLNLSEEQLTMVNDLWEEFKTVSDVGVGIYVICGVILAALLALAVLQIVKKRRWAKLYN